KSGVDSDTTVVLYGGNNNWFAAYAYWILKLRGFDNVKLLHGGRKKWELESRELTMDQPTSKQGDVSVSGGEKSQIRAPRAQGLRKGDGPRGVGACRP